MTEAELAELQALENELGGLTQEEFNEMKELEKLERQMKAQGDTPSTAQDFATSMGQGATMGFGDEISGALGAVLDPQDYSAMLAEAQAKKDALRAQIEAQDPALVAQQMRAEGFSDDEIIQHMADLKRFGKGELPSKYELYRDQARRASEERSDRSPIASTLGEMTGAIGTGVLTGAASIPAMMAEGAVYGLGSAEGDASSQLTDAALSAATGAGLGVIGKGAGKVFDKAKNYMSSAAERQAVKALNPTTAQMKGIFDEQRMGRALLDEDLVGPLRSTSSMQKKALSAEQKLAKDLDVAYDEVGGPPIPVEEVAARLTQRAEEIAPEVANRPVVKKILDFTDDLIDGKARLDPKDLRKQRRAVDKVTNFNSDAPTQQANQTIRDVLRNVEDDAFSAQGLGDEFVALKRKFGDVADARRILDRSSARDKAGTLTELAKQAGLGGVGGLGYQTANPYLMGAAALGYGARKVGHGGAAKALDRMSKMGAPTMRIPFTQQRMGLIPSSQVLNRMVQANDPYSFE